MKIKFGDIELSKPAVVCCKGISLGVKSVEVLDQSGYFGWRIEAVFQRYAREYKASGTLYLLTDEELKETLGRMAKEFLP
jgi:hypothetical protein